MMVLATALHTVEIGNRDDDHRPECALAIRRPAPWAGRGAGTGARLLVGALWSRACTWRGRTRCATVYSRTKHAGVAAAAVVRLDAGVAQTSGRSVRRRQSTACHGRLAAELPHSPPASARDGARTTTTCNWSAEGGFVSPPPCVLALSLFARKVAHAFRAPSRSRLDVLLDPRRRGDRTHCHRPSSPASTSACRCPAMP